MGRQPYKDKRSLPRVARIDMRGRRFGRLVALEDAGTGDGFQGDHRWRCICDCGVEKTVSGVHLRSGRTASCGARCALRPPKARPLGGDPSLYGIWKKMRDRCDNRRNKRFADYGCRGIRVCPRWETFALFCVDVGQRPSAEHSLDRFPDMNGNYEPGNVRWATRHEQQRNMRRNRLLAWNGETLPLSAWAEKVGLSTTVLATRLRRGWSLEDALTKPRAFIRSQRSAA